MPTRGFVNGGFYHDKLLGGGGNINMTISAPTVVNNGGGNLWGTYATQLYPSGPQDIIAKNLTVNSALVPMGLLPAGYGGAVGLYKIICSGNLILNSGGYVSVNGRDANGSTTYTSPSECKGFIAGSVGGSSGCAGSGQGGGPFNNFEPMFYLGGSGGQGLGVEPGTPGAAQFDTVGTISNNVFQPSIYNDGTIMTNYTIEMSLNDLAGPVIIGMVFGGAGGGGCGGGVGSPAAGGAGGGVCYISCDKLILNEGNIYAKGQPSSNGGGGGGGVVIIVCSEVVWQGLDSVIDAHGGGTGGQQGGGGRILLFSNTLVASFDTTMTFAQYSSALRAYQAHT
jgi:hypothetical protein